jgi:hypothetical protein
MLRFNASRKESVSFCYAAITSSFKEFLYQEYLTTHRFHTDNYENSFTDSVRIVLLDLYEAFIGRSIDAASPRLGEGSVDGDWGELASPETPAEP